MKRKTLLIVLSVFLFFNVCGQNQRLVFHHITSEQGLSQNHGICIGQDHKGFMWFGTNNGLNKYDGEKITVYKNDSEDSSSLSNNMITAIYEDNDKNLWIGTRGGLNLYNRDMDTFTRFRLDPDHPESLVYTILEDSHNDLYIGTAEGVYVLNNEHKIVHLANIPTTCLYEDTQGNLWIGARALGLYLFDRKKKKFKHYEQTRISSIVEDHHGNLWIATWGNGLVLFDRKKEAFTLAYTHDFRRPESISADMIYSMYKDRKGNIWIGTENRGLNLFDPLTRTFEIYAHDVANRNSISNNTVSAIYEDRTGTLWFGVHRGGINYCNPRLEKFQHYQQEPCSAGLSHNNIKGFCEDTDGKIWIATDGGGVNLFNPSTNTFTYFRHDPKDPNTISSNVIICVYEDRQKNIWISAYLKGVTKYDRKTNKLTHYKHDPNDKSSLSHDNAWDIFEDSKANLWIGTHVGGLNLMDRASGRFAQYKFDANNEKSLSSNVVTAIYEDKKKNLWIGTDSGLNLFDPTSNSFTRFYSDDKPGSLSHNNILSIFEDQAGNLWVGTVNGLNLFDPQTATAQIFTTKNGFPNNVIQSIIEDDHANLWISTLEGIFKFNYKSNRVRNYQATDGLQGNEFIQNAALKTKDGKMMFGGNNGFNFFHPDSVKDNRDIPPVYVTGFQLFNKPVEISEDSPLKKHISEVKEITLSYKQSVFSFEFSVLNYISPEKNQYAYKMEGFDKEWIYAGTQNSATYTNLNPGEYVFKVKASNNDGFWNEQGTSVNIIIPPPFWLTWWFRTLAGLATIGGVLLFLRIRLNVITKQKAELDKQVKQRTAEVIEQKEALVEQAVNMQTLNGKLQAQTESLKSMNEMLQQQKKEIINKHEEAEAARQEAEKANHAKSIFLATMSHEIRTPMNGVIGMASLMAETSLTLEQREYTAIIQSSGENLLGVINDILDFSKIESGKMELEEKDFDLRTCIEEVLDMFASKASTIGLDLIYQMDPDVPDQIIGDSLRLRQVLLNLVGNAIKFTHQGEIFLGVHLHKRANALLTLGFDIRDTGIGIPEDKLNRLFKAFSQVDASTTRKYGGTGLGLAITEKLVELMGGQIWIESTVGKGTTFFFTLSTKLSEKPAQTYVYHDMASVEGKKVLVVDDNQTNRSILKNQLEHWKLRPTLAFSAKQALEILSQSPGFDLVLTDMQMPETDGLQLGNSIHELYPALPVILMSSIGDERNEKYHAIFSVILSKPVKQSVLSKSILISLHKYDTSAADKKTGQKLHSDFAKQYPLHILIADDNPINQKLAIRVLAKLGYQADVVSNGKEVIEAFIKMKYDLILMDIQMPEMDGLEATQKIRTLSGTQPLIIAMTANAMQGDREMCLQAGMDDYISKPINLDQLVSTLEKWAQTLQK
ncbi:response regulator [Fulvivirgaceae bacterium PWU5]|uniref:Sensory/regulatory protein RpfC n=1 Tax=Dawidia cretensis TaxID=2782350 RepID=A0AAP2DZG8_9BACT|nr:hybrid sensor histidine kinase/response regulator [Dawidia cretensis]MBT1710035.1 response regulator [Dawidia cretensis]